MENIEDDVGEKPEKPEECDSCGYETEHLTLYDSHNGDNPLAWLCKICASTHAGNAYHYPRQYENRHIMQQISYCANLILDEIRRTKAGSRLDASCIHEWVASTLPDVLCICSKCNERVPRK